MIPISKRLGWKIGVAARLALVRACITLAALGLSLPALSWAEGSTSPLLSGPPRISELRVAVAQEMEAIATRTLARVDDPPQGGGPARAAIRPEEGFRSGTWRLGLMGGYSVPHKVFAPRSADVHFAPLLAQIGYTLTDVHLPFPIRGSLELVLEPSLLLTTSPDTTIGEGLSLLLRYNFVTGTRWVPFFDFGPGIQYWSLRVPTILESRFNFTLQGGPGLHYFVTDHLAITGQVRLHHISNNGRERPNVGINSSLYLLGVSYFF
ncbi:MAG: acyloxyacyl hydrolase [Candidatus Methylomirabilis sp.]